jgi:hypothetical protein
VAAYGRRRCELGRERELAGELRGVVKSDGLAFYRLEAKGEAVGQWLAQGAAYKVSNGGGCAAWRDAGLPATVRPRRWR